MTFKTAFKSLVASAVITGTFIAPVLVLADETPIVEVSSDVQVSVVTETPVVDMAAELADLKARESDPASGFVTRFFLRIKIKELENKLNIATALK